MEKKDKIELGIIAVSVIILIFIAAKAASGARKYRPIRPKAKQINNLPLKERLSPKSKPAPQQDLFSKLDMETMDLELKRDPFSAAVMQSEKVSVHGLSLSGIVWDKDKPSAIINNNICAGGDIVNGYVIRGIKKDKVIFTDGNQEFELKLE